MRSLRTSSSGNRPVRVIIAAFVVALGGTAASAKEKVLYSFHGGSDGAVPYSALIADSSGNLYGTTSVGGGGSCQFGGCGTVFELAPDGTETVLYPFAGGSDGAYPRSGLVADSKGDVYGTASSGGAHDDGTVFTVSPDGMETTLYAFQGGSDGAGPLASLIFDQNGNLYGTTVAGGNQSTDCDSGGCGTVFELPSGGKEAVLYRFEGGTDGSGPVSRVIVDGSGNLYGTTLEGGANCQGSNLGCGTVFKLAPDGTETQLHVFQGGSDGALPEAGLINDGAASLYGTTASGGDGTSCGDGCGTVYKIASDGTETVLYSFKGGDDGYAPYAGVIMDHAGNLYGTTTAGGGTKCHRGGCGTVFKLSPDGEETVLFSFSGGHGRYPSAALLRGPNHFLYGTASEGGVENDGVVFSVKK